MSCGICVSGNKFNPKSGGSSMKPKAPNWGVPKKMGGTKAGQGNPGGGFGSPKVRMSFGRGR